MFSALIAAIFLPLLSLSAAPARRAFGTIHDAAILHYDRPDAARRYAARERNARRGESRKVVFRCFALRSAEWQKAGETCYLQGGKFLVFVVKHAI